MPSVQMRSCETAETEAGDSIETSVRKDIVDAFQEISDNLLSDLADTSPDRVKNSVNRMIRREFPERFAQLQSQQK